MENPQKYQIDPELLPISYSIRGIIQISPLVQAMVAPKINIIRLMKGLQVAGSLVRATNMTVARKVNCLVPELLLAVILFVEITIMAEYKRV